MRLLLRPALDQLVNSLNAPALVLPEVPHCDALPCVKHNVAVVAGGEDEAPSRVHVLDHLDMVHRSEVSPDEPLGVDLRLAALDLLAGF